MTIFRSFAIFVFAGILLIAGCSGGGGGSENPLMETMTPDETVRLVYSKWLGSSDLGMTVDKNGKPSITTTESGHLGYIKFKDLSGQVWDLIVEKVEYDGESEAEVYTSYVLTALNELTIKMVFNMIKDQGVWALDSITLTEIPKAVPVNTGDTGTNTGTNTGTSTDTGTTTTDTGIKGFITDNVTSLPVEGAKIEVFNKSTGVLSGSTVTAADGSYSVLELAPGTYYIVVGRDGYSPYTIDNILVS